MASILATCTLKTSTTLSMIMKGHKSAIPCTLLATAVVWSVHLLKWKVLPGTKTADNHLHSARTQKNTEQFFLTPFQIEGQAAESFKLSATLTACPFGESGELCGLAFNCQNRYPTSFFSSVMVTFQSPQLLCFGGQQWLFSPNFRVRFSFW